MNKARIILTLTLALLLGGAASAQSQASQNDEVFKPHWYLQTQFGVGHHRGEAKFDKLISPTAALSLGYQFDPIVGLRLGASGWEARNGQAHPLRHYKWNYVQGNLDVTISLLNLFKKKAVRPFDLYLFAGGGIDYSFNNDDCVKLADNQPDGSVLYEKLWRDNRWNPVVRGGLGIDVMLTKRIKFNLEGNTNMLPDHFNSKKGRSDNKDWVSNVLVGLKIALGPTTRSVAPAVAPVVQEVVEEPKVEVAPAKVVEPAPVVQQPVKREPMRVEVFFDINKTVIRASETGKLQDLVAFLKKYPTDLVSLTGYADRDTGTSQINRRLSVGRAAAVKKYLMDNGIAESRIMSDAKGDTVQPNNTPASNRVVICITETK